MKKRSDVRGGAAGKGWLVALALELMSCIIMGLVMVLCNIDRTATAYSIVNAQSELGARQNLQAKLEVERERLLSPYELRRKAEEFGMYEPKAHQVRRMEIQ
ncbi:MAG: hypothetical protein LBO64_06925 [Desulfovibrio sp.]|nr:hypothetical protein [Desulfovibrio sp.]